MATYHILVVEDDPDINRLLCRILTDGGYDVRPAFSGSEAVLWAEQYEYDLVLLDLMLPGLTGEEFIAQMRRKKTMPILVLSAKAGLEDRVNVLVPRVLLEQRPVTEGMELEVEGEVRSFNNKSGKGSRLVITLYAKELRPAAGEHENQLLLAGVLCKPPVVRRTPLGRDICDLMLAVNRRYGRADYLPCIAWGGLARRCGALEVGDGVRIEGRLQSRAYTKVDHGVSEVRTAYEVSVMKLEPVET